MEDNPALREAALVVDAAEAQDRADLISAFYLRLKQHRIPPALRREFTILEFWPADVTVWEDED